MSYTKPIHDLIQALRCLPSVGPKSAQRMALHLIERNRTGGKQLAQALTHAMESIQNCAECRNFSEKAICTLCTHPSRESNLLCIVESPADMIAIEQTQSYRGRYFVLMGRLSPLDRIGPKEIGIDLLKKKLDSHELLEVILAINPTLEGEATVHYLAELIKGYNIKATRIAYGVPLGAELEFIDDSTLTHAIKRRELI